MPKEPEKPRAAELRAMKLDAAWRSHVGKLTLAQMSSPTACLEHLKKYGMDNGWPETLDVSANDVPQVVSSYLHSRVAPSADAMFTLVTMEQQFALNRALEEVLVQSRLAAEQGVGRTAWIEARAAFRTRSLSPDFFSLPLDKRRRVCVCVCCGRCRSRSCASSSRG